MRINSNIGIEETDRIHQEARRTDRTTETDYRPDRHQAGLTEQGTQTSPHVLAQQRKKRLTGTGRANEKAKAVQKQIEGKKQRPERKSPALFLRLGY
ncbi:hypothetical protein AB2F24_26095 (plasmid) [Escherichia coli]